MDFAHAVLIGRFQPFHNQHLAVVKQGLQIAENVIIVVGSSFSPPSIRNPFTHEEIRMMIWESIPDIADRRRFDVVPVRDYYYNDNVWLSSVQAQTDRFIEPGDSVALLGSYKDGSSNWLSMFPQWEFVPYPPRDVDATSIREFLFNRQIRVDWERKPANSPTSEEMDALRDIVPAPVLTTLKEWVTKPLYADLAKEWNFIRDYKRSWEEAPFPPVFVTADAIVVCSGHVLIIKRKINPGKGLYALPGGFIKQNEFIKDGAIRELREETGIRVDKLILESQIASSHVFDYPARSLRGRTITHGFYIKLKDGPLPEIKAGDDAAEAMWMPLWDAMSSEDRFFEDHLHIISYFVGAQGER